MNKDLREKSFKENGYYVTTFTTAKQVGTVCICSGLDFAKATRNYYRKYYSSVKILTREELHEVQEREKEERMRNYAHSY